jgi:hypothetical protein
MELRSQDDFCIFALMLCHGLLTRCRTTFCIGTAASRLLFVAVGFWINYIAFCKSTLATGASKLLHRDSLVQCYICLRSSMVFGAPLPADRGRVAAYRVCRGCLRICFLFFHLLISILSRGGAVATSDHENVSVTQEMKFHRQNWKSVILSWLLRPLHPKWSSIFKKWRKMRFWVAPQRVPRSRSPGTRGTFDGSCVGKNYARRWMAWELKGASYSGVRKKNAMKSVCRNPL